MKTNKKSTKALFIRMLNEREVSGSKGVTFASAKSLINNVKAVLNRHLKDN